MKAEDNLDTLNKRLKEVKEAYDRLKKQGFDREILEAFLRMKTGLNKKDIREVLDNTELFFKKLSHTVVEKEI